MFKGKKRQRVKKNTPSPNPGKVARRLNMDSVSFQENTVENNTSSDGEPSLREIHKQLQYVTKKIEEIDRQSF